MYWVRFAQDCLAGHLPLPTPHLVLELCIGFGLSVVVRPVKHHYHHQYLASQAPLPLPHIPIYMTILPSPYLHPTSWVLMYYVLQSNIIPIPYMTNDHWPWGNFMTEACTILTSNGLFIFWNIAWRKANGLYSGCGGFAFNSQKLLTLCKWLFARKLETRQDSSGKSKLSVALT